jgi:hypothetical protein
MLPGSWERNRGREGNLPQTIGLPAVSAWG